MLKRYLIISAVLFGVLAMPIFLMAADYKHQIEIKEMVFAWTLAEDQIHVKLSAKTTGWVGIGFSPEKAMQGANIIIGAVQNGKFKVQDHYGSRKTGHKSDEKLGGESHILNPGGTQENGITTITFSLPLSTKDKWDKEIKKGRNIIMFAYSRGKDSFKTGHRFRTVYDIDLTTGGNKKIK